MTSEQRIVIVGGGPAALSTARSYRDAGGEAAVDLVSAEPHLPYERPPLTKELLRGELEPAELALEDEPWFAAHAVTLRRGRAAVLLAALVGLGDHHHHRVRKAAPCERQ